MGGREPEVVRDNLETLYGAVDEAALPIALPAFVRKEFEGYLGCGLLCRGFAHLAECVPLPRPRGGGS
jgi:hypothetical protein